MSYSGNPADYLPFSKEGQALTALERSIGDAHEPALVKGEAERHLFSAQVSGLKAVNNSVTITKMSGNFRRESTVYTFTTATGARAYVSAFHALCSAFGIPGPSGD